MRARALALVAAAAAITADAALAKAPPAKPLGPVKSRGIGGHLKLAQQWFKLDQADEKRRLVIRCPGRRFPFGGAISSYPPPSADGEGVYPHSYERLGRQRGWHVSAVLYDPSPRSTTPRRVRFQVVCGRDLGHVTPPHTTVFIPPGQTRSAVARCPGRRHLFSGGFQRTNFVTRGGNFVTEARALDSKTWRVTGRSFGNFGGELTAVAYCTRSKRPFLREVAGSSLLSAGALGTAVTPPCPRGRRLTFGGFSANGSDTTLFGDGAFTRRGRWMASGYATGGSTDFSAYGYCLKI